MITPTIGRVVLVHIPESSQPWPALICYVHSDTIINVGGFSTGGAPFQRNYLPLEGGDESLRDQTKEYAYWMPYQKKVAGGS
jgi:hypothetical protein